MTHSSAALTDVYIDLPPLYTGNLNTLLCDARITCADGVLWQGLCGTTARFCIDAPTEICITICSVYTGRLFHLFEDIVLRARVIPSCGYVMQQASGRRKFAFSLQRRDAP